MSVISLKTRQKYGTLLAGNEFFMPSAYESIATATGSTFSFTSIPSTYQHLQLRYCITKATSGTAIGLRFNNDSSSVYSYHQLGGDGSSAFAAAIATDSYAGIDYIGGPANQPMVGIVDIHDYASTTKNKTVRNFSGFDANGSGTVLMTSCLWRNTAAINRIDSVLVSGLSTASWALYGIKGA